MSDYSIRPYRPGDEAGILATFNLVFGADDPSFVPRTIAEWRWAFDRNPAGRRVWVAEKDGVIAAQCAALPFRVRIDGREAFFTQGVDSMVHPAHRQGLRRPGLFVATARPFFEAFSGRGEAESGKDLLHYGWPVEPAWRIGKTFLGYEIVRTQLVLYAAPGSGARETPPEVERLSHFGPEVLALYERCAAGWGASTIRDARYLNWRFAEHPRFRYHLLAVRDGAALRGYAVFRRADVPRKGSGLVVDWLVPEDDVEAGTLLREAVLAQARADEAEAVVAVFPDVSSWFHVFQDWGFRAYPSDYLLIGIVQNPRYDTWWLREHWWYQLAELDTV